MAEIITERQMRENFRKVAENFKRCLRAMGYEDVRGTSPLDVLENKELKTTFVIDYGEKPIPSYMNIRMKAKGMWANIYAPYPPMEKELIERLEKKISIPPVEGAERLYDETWELVVCERCGCIDFVKRGEEYVCAVCCRQADKT